MHKFPTKIFNKLVNEGRGGGLGFSEHFRMMSSMLLVQSIIKRSFSLTSRIERRKPPKEEYENNGMHTRKKTADPFDR